MNIKLNESSWVESVFIMLHLSYMLYTPAQGQRVLWVSWRWQMGFKKVKNNVTKNNLFPGPLTPSWTTDASPQIFTVAGESGVSVVVKLHTSD